MANIRAAYAECSTAALTEDDTGKAKFEATNKSASETVDLTQQKAGWTGDNGKTTIGGQTLPTIADGSKTVTVTVTTTGGVTFDVK